MKRVLIIAPDFLPSSYPPALRIYFFVQHLPEFGWQPIVVTIDPKYYEWPVDAENEYLLPDSLQVVRTPAFSASLTRKIGIGDLGLRSLWYHWHTASWLCKMNCVDLVFISLPPFFPAVLGRLLFEKFNIPYVIDYGDPWINPFYRKFLDSRNRTKRTLSHGLSRILEPFVMKHVAHVVGVSRRLNDQVRSPYPWLAETDTTEIPLGAEPSDFDYVRTHPRKNSVFNSHDGFLHISYVGVCPSAMHDTVRALFLGVRLGMKWVPQLFDRLRLHFVGTTYAPKTNGFYPVLSLAREAGVERFVDEHPLRIAYLGALQLLLDSHALVVVGSNAPHYTASKIFPYILARKPLLAVFHEASSVVRILSETQAGRVVTFTNEHPPIEKVEEISKHLEEILSLPPGYEPPTRWDAFEAYTARAMTKRLSKVFDQVVST